MEVSVEVVLEEPVGVNSSLVAIVEDGLEAVVEAGGEAGVEADGEAGMEVWSKIIQAHCTIKFLEQDGSKSLKIYEALSARP